jgi:hypothetical protein
MAVKKDTGLAKSEAILIHHVHCGATSKLSHNNSRAATHPADTTATRHLRTAMILRL